MNLITIHLSFLGLLASQGQPYTSAEGPDYWQKTPEEQLVHFSSLVKTVRVKLVNTWMNHMYALPSVLYKC